MLLLTPLSSKSLKMEKTVQNQFEKTPFLLDSVSPSCPLSPVGRNLLQAENFRKGQVLEDLFTFD